MAIPQSAESFFPGQGAAARVSTPRRRNDVLVELGKDSLMESYLWAIHRYHRSMNHPVPAAGTERRGVRFKPTATETGAR